MRLRTGILWTVALYCLAGVCNYLYDAHLIRSLGESAELYTDPRTVDEDCPLGTSPLSVDGAPERCLTQAQFDARKLANRAIAQGNAESLLIVLKDACEGGERGSCDEATYIREKTHQ